MTYVGNWKNCVLCAILVCHILWMVFHLSQAATDSINPWKLGGYGMYVQPNKSAYTEFWLRDSQSEALSALDLDVANFKTKNLKFNLHCKPPTASSFQVLFKDNPEIVGKELKLEIMAPEFMHEQLRVDYRKVAEMYIEPRDEKSFVYSGTVCGKQREEKQVLYLE
jgi:hypothetical protein